MLFIIKGTDFITRAKTTTLKLSGDSGCGNNVQNYLLFFADFGPIDDTVPEKHMSISHSVIG